MEGDINGISSINDEGGNINGINGINCINGISSINDVEGDINGIIGISSINDDDNGGGNYVTLHTRPLMKNS